jgi:hypothetical protein
MTATRVPRLHSMMLPGSDTRRDRFGHLRSPALRQRSWSVSSSSGLCLDHAVSSMTLNELGRLPRPLLLKARLCARSSESRISQAFTQIGGYRAAGSGPG